MSLTTARNNRKPPAVSGQTDRAFVAVVISTIAKSVGNAIVKVATLLLHAAQAVAEARMQRAAIETQLYRNRYKHSSKNDDDLPIVR